MSSAWKYYALCPSCDYFKYAPFGLKIHTHIECCPQCGTDIDDFKIRKMRFNDESVIWYNPKTWGTGFWETYKK